MKHNLGARGIEVQLLQMGVGCAVVGAAGENLCEAVIFPSNYTGTSSLQNRVLERKATSRGARIQNILGAADTCCTP